MAKKLTIENGHVTTEDGILDALDLVQGLGSDTMRQWMLKHITNSRAGKLMMRFKDVDFTPAGPPAYAQIQWGRWVVNCECGGQENVSFDEPYFFCMSCFNSDNHPNHKDRYAVRPIVFPDDKDEIEKELMKRQSKYRHWLKGETLEDLQNQTKELEKESNQ